MSKTKPFFLLLFTLLPGLILFFVPAGCSYANLHLKGSEISLNVKGDTDSKRPVLPQPKNVVALSASLAELWLEAGGILAGATSDAFEKGRISQSLGDAANVGSLKNPNVELILSLEPDLVILAPKLSGYSSARRLLEEAKVPCYYAEVDSFNDYLVVFQDFTHMTGRDDLYEQYGKRQKDNITALIAALPSGKGPQVLVLRAYSSGINVKSEGVIITNILDDLGLGNIASGNAALTENFSLEKIVEADPDCIFIVYMGDSAEKTTKYLKQNLYENPVWSTLSAVSQDRTFVLPQELFHYKPNSRWEEAYAYIAELLYTE